MRTYKSITRKILLFCVVLSCLVLIADYYITQREHEEIESTKKDKKNNQDKGGDISGLDPDLTHADQPKEDIADASNPTNNDLESSTNGGLANDKIKQRKAEKAEKEKLERWVRKEYEDELAGIKSKLVPLSNSTKSLLLPKPLLFLHIPKTAGSTLADVFKKNNNPRTYYHFWNHPRLNDLPIVPRKDTIFGHFRYGLHYYMPDSPSVSYATMLRDPVDRVISYYHFHLQDPQDPGHNFALTHTFEEWLELSDAAQNEMTKCLSGIRSEFIPSVESFEMAKHHLRNFGFVGITERFQESLVLMQYYLGFTDISYHTTKIGIKKPKEITDEMVKMVEEKNWMDIELYEIAKKIFEKEIDQVAQFLWDEEMKQMTH